MSTYESIADFEEMYPSAERKAHELLLFLDTTGSLYKNKQQVARMLAARRKNGTYDHKLAPKAWVWVANAAAKQYVREMGPSPTAYTKMFPPVVRMAVAIELANRWYANAKAGRPEEI